MSKINLVDAFLQVSFNESVLDEVMAVCIGSPVNIKNIIRPSSKVFMSRSKVWLEKFPVYKLLSHHQKRSAMESHISWSVPLFACQLQTCSTWMDQMCIMFNQDEIDFFKTLSPSITTGALAAPAINFKNLKSHNLRVDDIKSFFPDELVEMFPALVGRIDNIKKLLKADKDMLDICLLIHNLEKITMNNDQTSDLQIYIKNLKQLILRKLGSLQPKDIQVDSVYHQVMPQLELNLKSVENLYKPLTQNEKGFLLKNEIDFEVGLPKL